MSRYYFWMATTIDVWCGVVVCNNINTNWKLCIFIINNRRRNFSKNILEWKWSWVYVCFVYSVWIYVTLLQTSFRMITIIIQMNKIIINLQCNENRVVVRFEYSLQAYILTAGRNLKWPRVKNIQWLNYKCVWNYSLSSHFK